jgi:hypothetical protein
MGKGRQGNEAVGRHFKDEAVTTIVPAKRSPDRSKPLQVTGRRKVALDAMVWEGLQYADAAKVAGLTARSMRKALDKVHVCSYLAAGKKQLRTSEGPRTFRRLVQIAHSERNLNASVVACREVLRAPDDEHPHRIGALVPGFVIVLREQSAAVGGRGSPVVIDGSRADDAPLPASESLVRQIARDGDQ